MLVHDGAFCTRNKIFGTPVPVLGHNEHCGWAFTTNEPNVGSSWRETFDDPDVGYRPGSFVHIYYSLHRVRIADLLGDGLRMGPGLCPVAELLVGAYRNVFVHREFGKGLGDLYINGSFLIQYQQAPGKCKFGCVPI